MSTLLAALAVAGAASAAQPAAEPCFDEVPVPPARRASAPARRAAAPQPTASAAQARQRPKKRAPGAFRRVEVPCPDDSAPAPPTAVLPPAEEPPAEFTPAPDFPPPFALASPPPETPLLTLPEVPPDCECFAPAVFWPAGAFPGGGGYVALPPPAIVAVTPIPEPATWALMLSGAAILLRRRAR